MRLSRILPEDEQHEAPQAEAPAPPPLTLESEPAPPEFSTPSRAQDEPVGEIAATRQGARIGGLSFLTEAAADAPPAFIAPAPVGTAPQRPHDSGFDLPPPPSAPAVAAPPAALAEPASGPHMETAAPLSAFDAMDFGAPAQSRFDTAEHAAEPPPFVAAAERAAAPAPVAEPEAAAADAEARVSPWRRRFTARPEPVAATPTEEEAAGPTLFDAASSRPAGPQAPPPVTVLAPRPPVAASPFDDAFQGAEPHGFDHEDEPAHASPTPLFERPLFFVILGLVGVALFAGSIFCMMNRASFTCLLIGVVGVLAMAPAAAFFLFRFLGKPVDPASEEHASLSQMAHMEPAPAHAAAESPLEAANDSPFDSAWRS